ncbi:hypothetical protein NPIL_71031 [Nephila pilipes]|uniref:Uncharacterized protein n=1 Tax=Nephila pilipes TaxID=299642 RepID=A0A8X6MUL8_NEPPI|nr:hypothetical protein NPIL_71031 [Nephila pilipes]
MCYTNIAFKVIYVPHKNNTGSFKKNGSELYGFPSSFTSFFSACDDFFPLAHPTLRVTSRIRHVSADYRQITVCESNCSDKALIILLVSPEQDVTHSKVLQVHLSSGRNNAVFFLSPMTAL